ncbi:hypothetical protein Q7O_003210 [Pectobacterium carotovorum subsp. carotovorum PCCS1]|nr:hypothetical protein [Pectobacterium carotovorum subsp. carotovorum PCCS1]
MDLFEGNRMFCKIHRIFAGSDEHTRINALIARTDFLASSFPLVARELSS